MSPAEHGVTVDVDGVEYPVRLWHELSAEEWAEVQRLYAEAQAQLEPLRHGTAEEMIAAYFALDPPVNAMLAILIPTLPAERIAALHKQAKGAFVKWWGEQSGLYRLEHADVATTKTA